MESCRWWDAKGVRTDFVERNSESKTRCFWIYHIGLKVALKHQVLPKKFFLAIVMAAHTFARE